MRKASFKSIMLALALLLSPAAVETAYAESPAGQGPGGCVETDKCGLKDFLDGAKTPEERQRRYEDFMKLLGVLGELAAYRERLLDGKDYIDLFPTAYYHTTVNEMERIRRGEYQYPVEKMAQMLAFYDAYKVNRQNWDAGNVRGVEEHWRRHFQIAAEQNSGSAHFAWEVVTVLNSGVDAHVNYDLARAIRHAYQNRFDRGATPGQLLRDFDLTDRIFPQTVSKANADIAAAFSFNGFDRMMKGAGFKVGSYLVGDENVIEGRHQAWRDAFGGSALKAKGPQPVTDHDSLFDAGRDLCPAQADAAPTFDGAHVFGVNRYVNTGLAVGRGDRIFFRASGSVSFGPNVGSGGPEGITFFFLGPLPVAVDPTFSYFSEIPHGALIGRVTTVGAGGREGWFYIGRGGVTTAESPGVLELNVNDTIPGDNVNAFRVDVAICKAK